MNKTQLVKYVSRKTKLPHRDAWAAVDYTLDCIKKYTTTREGVRLAGFGNFKCVTEKPERKWNPRTKRYRWSKPQRQIYFMPNKAYKECVYK